VQCICVQAHSDKSRDYTIPDTGLLSMPQAPGMPPTAAPAWQGNPQSPSMFAGNVGAQTLPDGQISSWNPSMQGVRPGFPPAPGTYPGQAYVPSSSMPMYPTSGGPPTASADSFQPSQQMSQYAGIPPNTRPAGSSPVVGQPPMYY